MFTAQIGYKKSPIPVADSSVSLRNLSLKVGGRGPKSISPPSNEQQCLLENEDV